MTTITVISVALMNSIGFNSRETSGLGARVSSVVMVKFLKASIKIEELVKNLAQK
jgi:hypothetical protein